MNRDVVDFRGFLRGREFEGNRPARAARNHAQFLLQAETVDFHDRAVNFIRQRFALFVQFVITAQHVINPLTKIMKGRRQAHSAEHGEHFELRIERHAFDVAERVEKGFERAFRGLRRVKLAQRSGGGVARIRKQIVAGLLARFVQLDEIRFIHIDFAAHFQARRQRKGRLAVCVKFLRQAQRNRLNRFEVLRHVFAGHAVAPRRSGDEDAVFVNRLERQAVNFRFENVFDGDFCAAAERPLDALIELFQFRFIHGVGKAQHRDVVRHRAEFGQRHCAHALRRRIGRHKFGMRGLDFLQAAHQSVVFGVGHFGVIIHVIEFVMAANLATQRFKFLQKLGVSHTRSPFLLGFG